MALDVLVTAGVGVAGIAGTLLGALIVARASREVTEIATADARRARSEDALRPLVAQLLRLAEEHASQVQVQVDWRSDPNAAVIVVEGAPAIGSTDPMYVLLAEFHVLVNEPDTANAAFGLYLAAVALDRWAYRPQMHLQGGQVTRIEKVALATFERQREEYLLARREFINAARKEFGRDAFPADTEVQLPAAG